MSLARLRSLRDSLTKKIGTLGEKNKNLRAIQIKLVKHANTCKEKKQTDKESLESEHYWKGPTRRKFDSIADVLLVAEDRYNGEIKAAYKAAGSKIISNRGEIKDLKDDRRDVKRKIADIERQLKG